MPKKKSTKKPAKTKKNKLVKLIIILVLLLFLAASGVLAHKLINKDDIAIPTPWGTRFGVFFDPDSGQPHVEHGEFGCCTPYCQDMYQIECSGEYGYDGTFHSGQRCDWDVPQCRQGCCLPDCVETVQIQCEGDYGYDGSRGWLPQACTELSQCEIGCCTLDSVKFQEMYLPCNSVGGEWQEGQCSLGYYVDLVGSTSGAQGTSIHGDIHAYTCSEELNSIWNATGQISGTTTIPGTDKVINIGPVNYQDDIFANFDETGYWDGVEQIGGNMGAEAWVDQSEFKLHFFMGSYFDLHMSGQVKSGAPECQERSNFGGIRQ